MSEKSARQYTPLPLWLRLPPLFKVYFCSGFGKNEDGVNGFYSDSLKKVDMPIVPQDRCRRIFLDNGLKASRVHPSWICVGRDDSGTADGKLCRKV